MRRIVFALAALLACSTPAAAQATVTATANWSQTEAPAVAQAFTETMKIDTQAPISLTAACVAATAPATGSACSATFPVASPTTNHSYVLVVCNSGFCSSASTGGAPPGLGGVKITFTVTITGTDDD